MLGAMSGGAQATADAPTGPVEPEPVPVGAGDEAAPHVEVSGVGVGRPRRGRLHYSAPTETGEVEVRDEYGSAETVLTDEQLTTTPKNSACPCGSGKKFKMCHGRR